MKNSRLKTWRVSLELELFLRKLKQALIRIQRGLSYRKFRKKANLVDYSDNHSNISSINSNHGKQLPNLARVHKSTHEMGTKERWGKILGNKKLFALKVRLIDPKLSKYRYIKYKSLLKQNRIETDRYNKYDNRAKLQSSSSSQNMSVQEMMLDKIYGTIEQKKHHL